MHSMPTSENVIRDFPAYLVVSHRQTLVTSTGGATRVITEVLEVRRIYDFMMTTAMGNASNATSGKQETPLTTEFDFLSALARSGL